MRFDRAFSVRLAFAAIIVAGLGACSETSDFFWYPSQVRGNKVDEETLAQLVPGTSTRQDVAALLGSPTAKASFDDNTWIYISEITRPVIAGTQGIEDQRVVVATFDDKGVLTKIAKRTQDDSLPVDVVARATPSPGTEASWLQQLLGNVGKFNAAAPDNKQGAQGTSTNPGNF